MGDVISLAEYRARAAGLPVALERLDRIVKRLEPLVLVLENLHAAELSIGNRSYILVAPAPIGSNL